MGASALRKPAFAAIGCCLLLLLCASCGKCQITSAAQNVYIEPYYNPYGPGPYSLQYSFYPGRQSQAPLVNEYPQTNGEYAVPTQPQAPVLYNRQASSAPQPDQPASQQQFAQQPAADNRQKNAPALQSRLSLGSQNYRPSSQDDAVSFPAELNAQPDSLPSHSTNGALRFAFSMLKEHVVPQQANTAICPILPQMLLASLYEVADPEAKQQLQTALQASTKELQRALQQQQQLGGSDGSAANQLDYASSYFVGADTKLNPQFASQASRDGVTFQPIDFRRPHEAASVANRWVTERTRGIIREIISPSSLDPATRLMMASVVYFKGKWKFLFTKTEPGTFVSEPSAPGRQVQMMYQYGRFRYGELGAQGGGGLHWVELPYEGTSGLSMVLVLPKVRHQLQSALQQLTLDDMNELMADLAQQRGTNKVHLHVPRFGVFSSASLVPALKSLGLRAVFERGSALAGLANEELVVRDVAQRTYIAVDEKGTTATSVASLSFVALSAALPPPTINFTVDEPFLAMIVDKKSAYPMFVAKIVQPEDIQN